MSTGSLQTAAAVSFLHLVGGSGVLAVLLPLWLLSILLIFLTHIL